MKTYIIVGTRPNFIKITQFKRVAKKIAPSMQFIIIHTGQHYNHSMAEIFFNQFRLKPDYFLNIKYSSPLKQISSIQIELEKLFDEIGIPDLIIVPGDVNSTLAGAITANKMGIKLAHLEAGLRSFDRDMPEEINRLIIDELSDLLFVTEPSGSDNLKKEHKKGKIISVGNTMIDTLVAFKKEINGSNIIDSIKLNDDKFVLVTIHRPSNVDNAYNLSELIKIFKNISKSYRIVFPIHPRTKKNITLFNLDNELEKLDVINPGPMGYFEFQNLLKNCAFALTDSGGIQEETTFQQIPCITLRKNTERPITIDSGTNTLVNIDSDLIFSLIKKIKDGTYKKGKIPRNWDGLATKRIIEFLNEKII